MSLFYLFFIHFFPLNIWNNIMMVIIKNIVWVPRFFYESAVIFVCREIFFCAVKCLFVAWYLGFRIIKIKITKNSKKTTVYQNITDINFIDGMLIWYFLIEYYFIESEPFCNPLGCFSRLTFVVCGCLLLARKK